MLLKMSILRSLTKPSNCISFVSTSNLLVFNRYFAKSKKITIHLLQSNGVKHTLTGEVDDNCSLLDLIHDNIDMPAYGVCGGMPGCTTCHVIFHPEDYKKFSEPLDKLETELLKNAPEVTSSSRLGCQVVLKEFMDGIEIKLPSKTIDYRSRN